jgi:hypothetical protein
MLSDFTPLAQERLLECRRNRRSSGSGIRSRASVRSGIASQSPLVDLPPRREPHGHPADSLGARYYRWALPRPLCAHRGCTMRWAAWRRPPCPPTRYAPYAALIAPHGTAELGHARRSSAFPASSSAAEPRAVSHHAVLHVPAPGRAVAAFCGGETLVASPSLPSPPPLGHEREDGKTSRLGRTKFLVRIRSNVDRDCRWASKLLGELRAPQLDGQDVAGAGVPRGVCDRDAGELAGASASPSYCPPCPDRCGRPFPFRVLALCY